MHLAGVRKVGHTYFVWRSYADPRRPIAGSYGVMGIVLEYRFSQVGCCFYDYIKSIEENLPVCLTRANTSIMIM